MFGAGKNAKRRTRRLVGAVALLFIFFLPLHFHFSLTSQVAKECSCIHGTRTQLVAPAGSPTIVPIFVAMRFAARYQVSWGGDWSGLQMVRGPPAAPAV